MPAVSTLHDALTLFPILCLCRYVQYRITSFKATPWFVNFHALRRTFTCQERLKALRKAGWNFYANEFSNPPAQSAYFTLARSGTLGNAVTYSALDVALDMDESAASTLNATRAPIAFLCEEFVNLMLFRNPYDRLRSQIAWIQKLYKEFYSEYLESDIKLAFLQRSSGFWERLLPAGVNNYYIRSLLGPRFFEFPMIHITRDHVLLAKLAALQYDVLLSLEHGAFNDASLRVGLGWEHALKKAQVRITMCMTAACGLGCQVKDVQYLHALDMLALIYAGSFLPCSC